MNRKIITAIAGVSLFVGLSMIAASVPAASARAAARSTPAAQRDAAADLARSGQGVVVNLDDGLGSRAVTISSALGAGGLLKVAGAEAPNAVRADILFDTD
ncbi:MAG: hypothetical protein QM820_18785 [Minicystis sp.]